MYMQVMADLERIHTNDNLRASARTAWMNVIGPQIIAQAQLEKRSQAVRSALTQCDPFKGMFCQFLIKHCYSIVVVVSTCTCIL